MNITLNSDVNFTNVFRSIVQADEEDAEETFNDELPNVSLILKIKNAIWLLENAIMNNNYPLKQADSLFGELISYLPYCLEDTKVNGVKILLNRQYIPLGWLGNRAPYEQFSYHHVSLSNEKIMGLDLLYGRTFWSETDSPFVSLNNSIKYLKKLRNLTKFLQSN